VSRTNISILLATALLGILLWIVLSIVHDLANAPDTPLPMPTKPEVVAFDPALPRIFSPEQLEQWLTQQGYSAPLSGQLVDTYRDWLILHGFHSGTPLLDFSAQPRAEDLYANYDGATLLILAGQGDIAALHILAESSLETDPLAALEWFDQAIVNGSVYAMVRISDLLATLADPELANFVSDSVWQSALHTLQNTSPAPLERALAWAIAAVTFGGYAVLDQSLAQRINTLSEQLEPSAIYRACEIAQDYVLTTAATRRAQGGTLFSTQTPPLALSVAQPEAVIPCDIPVLPLISLAHCSRNNFVGPDNTLSTAWLCPETG
jgi:hypothetical protein